MRPDAILIGREVMMDSKDDITTNMTMDVLMARYSEVISILIVNKIHCVGCLLAPFHDVGDAAREHELDADELLRLLHRATRQDSR